MSASELVVFVPGTMGSALLYEGPGPLSDPVREYIWSEDASDVVLGRNLQRLDYPSPKGTRASATHVLHRVTFKGFPLFLPVTEIYGTLISRWRHLAVSHKRLFVEFPYDWRAPIEQSGRQLAAAIVRSFRDSSCKSLVLVGHSMGGLVCRSAIGSSPELGKVLRVLVTIATPLQGSSKAFWTLKISPSLNAPFDLMLKFLKVRDVFRRDSAFGRAMDAIRTCPSVYELLPPKTAPALRSDTGALRACTEEQLWPPSLQRYASQARGFHNRLKILLDREIPLKVLYSSGHPTDHLYRVGPKPSYVFQGQTLGPQSSGDGTVSVESATHRCPASALHRVTTTPDEHLSICRNDEVLKDLEKLIFEGTE